ncbi:MAG: hypothetical protein J6Z14_04955 [Prevotella sp.]|nr:hypothetical protein [Prevotella sp.]
MLKKLLTKLVLLVAVVLMGASSAWAADADVTYDFTGTDWSVSNGTLTDGTVSFTGEGGANFKMNGGYFMMGKTGAYLNFPTYSSAVEKIVVTGRSGASAATKQNIFVGDVAVSEETQGVTGTNTYEIDDNYQAAGTQYTLKVTSSHNTQITKIEVFFAAGSNKTAAGLSFGETTTFTCDIYATFTAPTLIKVTDAPATYGSSDTDVATVDAATGAVAIVGTGTTTITAATDETATYAAGSASYTLTVTENEGVDPVSPASSAGYYVLVTDASTLAEGDQIIIAYADDAVAMSTEQKSNNRGATTITVNSDGTITAADDTQVIILEGDTDDWYFNVGTSTSNDYLYAASSSSNYLKTSIGGVANNDNSKASITIANDGTATIVFQGTYSRNWLKYNPNNGSPLFACYASNSTTGSEPQIYRYVAGTPSNTQTVTLSADGYKTLVATENFTVSGATAYIVTAADEDAGVTMTSIDVVPANEPVVLKGVANAEATLTFTSDDAEDASANLLEVSAAANNYNGSYVLAKKGTAVGFYKWAGGSLGAGRVYLPAAKVTSTGGGAREYLPFNFGEATGISSVKVSQSTKQVYNLNGQRVDSPKKGLYIVNGKKMILK